jgi:hypothetical protein
VSRGEEILRCHVETEEVSRGAVGAQGAAGVRGKRGDLLTTEEREEIRRLRRDNLVLDALTMALGLRGPGADVELVHHGDRGSST